jgi:biopolymer transport protein ExbD
MGDEVTFRDLGESTARAWRANSPSMSVNDCLNDSAPQRFTVGGRSASTCRIVIRADSATRYRNVLRAINALQNQGFTHVALTAPDTSIAFFVDMPALSRPAIRLEGLNPTLVRVAPPSPTGAVVLNVDNEASTMAELGAHVLRRAEANNPALNSEDIRARASISLRPDQAASYGSVLQVVGTLSDAGFAHIDLFLELAREG